MAGPIRELKIELEDELLEQIKAQAADRGYASAGEYVHDLVEAAASLSDEDAPQLRAALKEGFESGEPIALDAQWWERRRQRLRDTYGQHQ